MVQSANVSTLQWYDMVNMVRYASLRRYILRRFVNLFNALGVCPYRRPFKPCGLLFAVIAADLALPEGDFLFGL